MPRTSLVSRSTWTADSGRSEVSVASRAAIRKLRATTCMMREVIMRITGTTILITSRDVGIRPALAEAFHAEGNQVIIALGGAIENNRYWKLFPRILPALSIHPRVVPRCPQRNSSALADGPAPNQS